MFLNREIFVEEQTIDVGNRDDFEKADNYQRYIGRILLEEFE